jgi:bacterioferritin
MLSQLDPKVAQVLKEIVEFELAGVVRFTHYALMVRGPYRQPVVSFLQSQASESLLHAQRAGEILTGLDGHPSMKVSSVHESNQHSIHAILEESYAHEAKAVEKYRQLLTLCEGKSVFLEEYARGMVAVEEEHLLELRKMLRDLGD